MVFWILTWLAIAAPFAVGVWGIFSNKKYIQATAHSESRMGPDYGAFFGYFLASAIISAVAWVVVALGVVGIIAGATGKPEVVNTDKAPLTALNTGTDISGRFFLGTGSINGEPSFTYVFEQEDGGFQLSSANAIQSSVYEVDDATPHVEIDNYRLKPNEFWSPMSWMFNINYDSIYRFYVPKGSVLQNYQVAP